MAIWQISFSVIPKDIVGDADIISEEVFSAYEEDMEMCFDLPPNYASQISLLLPRSKGWSPDMELWGDDETDDFTIWRKAEKIESIGVRIDVRKLDDTLLYGVLVLVDSWSCILIERRYRKVCRMTLPEFRGLICGHPHSRSLKDPIAWFPVLADEVKRNEKKNGA